MNNNAFNQLVEATRADRFDYMFSSLIDQMCITCFAIEASKTGTPGPFIEELLRAWKQAAIEATRDSAVKRGLDPENVDMACAVVQDDAVDVCRLMRDTLSRIVNDEDRP